MSEEEEREGLKLNTGYEGRKQESQDPDQLIHIGDIRSKLQSGNASQPPEIKNASQALELSSQKKKG
jgi:hypothetical protein